MFFTWIFHRSSKLSVPTRDTQLGTPKYILVGFSCVGLVVFVILDNNGIFIYCII